MKVRVDAETADGKKYAQFYDVSKELLDNEMESFKECAADYITARYAGELVKITDVKVLEAT
jgi:hypothetical protein